VKQLQRDADAMSLAMNPRAVGAWALSDRGHARIEATFELGVVDRLDGRPVEPGFDRPPHREAHDASAHGDRRGDLTVSPFQQPLLAENLPRISHR
jgi:hypothetical protein